MQLFNRKIKLEITVNPIIGIALGRSTYNLREVKRVAYLLHILCFSIELETKKLIVKSKKKTKNEFIPHKKRKSFIAKYVLGFTILSGLCSALSLQQAYELHEMSLVYLSVVFTILVLVLGISYLAMDPKEKYYVG